MKDQSVLEEGVRLSQSQVWAAQRSYYDTQGIHAWAQDVPCFITSNPVIAEQYAKTVIGFIKDWQKRGDYCSDQPFYIIEIGAGHGQFGFYFLRALLPMLALHGLPKETICYVMTDFTEANIQFWEQHQSLIPFLNQGVMDFSQYDFENGEEVVLRHSKKTLSVASVKNPMTVIANYLFDSLVADVFHVHDNMMSESLVELTTAAGNVVNDQPQDWDKVTSRYINKPFEQAYYSDPLFNNVLDSYRHDLTDSYLTLPVGSFQGIRNLKNIANDRLMILTSDKAYSFLDELDGLDPPEIACHGSFSLMVNYDAIKRYCDLLDGGGYFTRAVDGFASGILTVGFNIEDCPNAQSEVYRSIGNYGSAEYFCIYEHAEETVDQMTLKAIASYLALSCWDPYIFSLLSDRISDIIGDADQDAIDYLSDHLPKVSDQFYFIPNMDDVLFDLAVYYHEQEEYSTAITYYLRSKEYFQPEYSLYFNLGFCYYYDENYPLALENINLALELSPNDPDAMEYFSKINEKISEKV